MNAPAPRRTQRGALVGIVASVVVIASVAVVGQGVAAQSAHESDRAGAAEEFADLVVGADEPVGVSGEEAVALLDESGTTELAAENAGMEPDELVEELVNDPTMFVTREALVGYLETAPTSDELTGVEARISAPLTAPVGVDVFNLNSRPSSSKVIYLDVDGHTTRPDEWTSGQQIVSAPYVDPATATAAQRDAVYEIWQRVSEDYLPFDVNVTTRDPGTGGLIKNSFGDDRKFGQRIVITPSSSWLGTTTLGIALVDVFDAPVDYSAFVFTSRLTPPGIAEAAAHEAGHTLGLAHDGTTSDEYYAGHGDWAPIMGRPTGKPVTQWSKGEYSGANNREDDVVEIAAYTGFSDDDHVCTALIGSTSTTSGVIGAGGDVDLFAVDLGVGPATVGLASPLAEGSDLHAKVTVRAPDGTELIGRPTVVTNWTSSVMLNVAAPGRYTVEVAPSGWLTPTTGFSTYGSMGAYQLQVAGASSGTAGAAPPCIATSGFTSVTPARLLDTRSWESGFRRIPAGGQIALQVSGRGGVPVGATAAVLSVVAVDPRGAGFLTTFPCTPTRPIASTVNFVTGQTVANTAIATLSPSGRLCVYAHQETDVVIDVTGWLGRDTGSKFNAVGPTRVMDTRIAQGATRLPAGGTVQADFSWLPAGASAVALNVTSTSASSAGFATVYPCAAARPPTSTVNFVAGDTRPNNTIVGLGGGRVCIYSMASTEIVVDLVGYFGPTGLSYLPTAPARLLDTRDTFGYLDPAAVVSYRPATASLGTSSAVSAAVNVTAVDHAVRGFVTAYDCVTRTTTSAVNTVVGQVNANGAIVPLGNGLDSCLFTQSGGNLVVDLNGWWVR